jgi:hypothetical protein
VLYALLFSLIRSACLAHLILLDLVILRGRVSKLFANWSKTAVIDVIGFLSVSLGSSTVQLHIV